MLPARAQQVTLFLIRRTRGSVIAANTATLKPTENSGTPCPPVVDVDVLVDVVPPHEVGAMMLVSIDTSPAYARARPFKIAPVARLMLVAARTLPVNSVSVPRVAVLTTRHHTLHWSPPTTLAVSPVVIRELADLKIQTPVPLRVSVPVSVKASAQ